MASAAEVPLKKRVITYRYIALNSDGLTVRGNLKAPGEESAAEALGQKGYQVVNIEIAPSAYTREQMFPSLFKVKQQEVTSFSRQLATLLDSGINLLPALELTQGQRGGSGTFKKLIRNIINDIRTGTSFSLSISKHSDVFGEIYSRTIAMGEQTGELQTALRQMVEHMEKQGAATKKVGKALSYPIMIAGVSVVVVIILMTTALPPLLSMFESLNVALPLPTRMLMGGTKFLTAYKFILLSVGFFLAVAVAVLIKQPFGRRLADLLLLKLPIVGPTTHMSEIARFARTLSVLVASGVPLQETMRMMPQTTNNSVMRRAMNNVYRGLMLGQGVSGPMARENLFPPLLVQMVTVGEESNTMGATLRVVADFYEAATDERISTMVGILQPLTTVLMAGVVGFIAMAVIMPLYKLTGSIG
ncbi:MAG: type II secretion system F family protein [Dehalococcoidia bacterium]|nr:type II secretion system F family protein [Dehalococcoidia bacterium]